MHCSAGRDLLVTTKQVKVTSGTFRLTVESMLLLVVLMAAILLTMRPWGAYFFSGLADHWDTKLMGQWMAWSADKILQGKVLLPDFHANFFYPHAYTLAFGDTFWIPSFVYAALYSVSHNIFLSFNGTMLFFWALSGLTMFALLRELSMSRVVCYVGAFVFCLIPFRLSYYYLFTASLVFALPLLFLLLIRWLRRPTMTRALLLSAGFLLSLTSNLYYTVIVSVPLLLVFLAYVVGNRNLLRLRQFYVSGAVMSALTMTISVVYLYPYLLLRTEGDYSRTTWDHLRYYVEAFHYVSTKFSVFVREMFNPPSRPVETVMFPGTVLAGLSAVYFSASVVRVAKRWPVMGSVRGSFLVAKFALWTLFWLSLLLNFYFYAEKWISTLNNLFYAVSVALVLLYMLSVFWPIRSSERRVIMSGMAAAAVVSFFLSLGPIITMMAGPDAKVVQLSLGPMAIPLESIPVFGSVRALARFGVVVHLYLVVASCYALDVLLKKHRIVLWICLIVPLLLVYEGRDVQSRFRHKFIDYTNIVNSEVIAKTKQLPEHSVLFQLPAGATKRIDATMVMQTIGDFHLLVNGHSGFWPAYYYELSSWGRDWRLQEITRWLREIWPPVYLILDRHSVNFLSTSWHRPFPQEELERDWQLLEQDQYYGLYTLKSRTFTTARITQRVRSDILTKNPLLSFSARTTVAADTLRISFRVLVNGVTVGDYAVGPNWDNYAIELPAEYPSNLAGDEVTLELLQDTGSTTNIGTGSGWEVRDLGFMPNR